MTKFIAENITMVWSMLAWIMGYALGYKHGLKDGDGKNA